MGEEGQVKVLKDSIERRSRVMMVVPLLRVVALFATATATIVMALNKEAHTFVVATVGNTPVKLTLTAKFQHNPANVMFVIANGVATLHSLLMLSLCFVSNKYDLKGLRSVTVATLDMMMIALVSGATTATVFMGELARHGNSHARWNKICNNFERYCNQGSGAIAASYIGILFLMIVFVVNIFRREQLNTIRNSMCA
ncbi:hypothetical protein Lser_V15G04082 [Lactuca serriola]